MTPEEYIENHEGGMQYVKGFFGGIVAIASGLYFASTFVGANVSSQTSQSGKVESSEVRPASANVKVEYTGNQAHTRYYERKKSGLAGLFGAKELVAYESPGKDPAKEYLDYANKTGDYSNFKQPTGIFQPYVCSDAKEARQNAIDYAPKGYLALGGDQIDDTNSNAAERRNIKTLREGVEFVGSAFDAVFTIHGLVKYGPEVLIQFEPVVTRLCGK